MLGNSELGKLHAYIIYICIIIDVLNFSWYIFFNRFESKLPEVFEHLNEVYRSITARLKAETFRVSDQNGLRFTLIVFPYQKGRIFFNFVYFFKTKSRILFVDYTHLFFVKLLIFKFLIKTTS